jgi:hypothetical protein
MTENPDDENRNSEKSSTPRTQWAWKDNIPLLVTAFSLLFIAIRLISISQYNFVTAYGILQASGTATVVVGTLIPAMVLIPTLALVLCGYLLLSGRVKKGSRQPVVIFLIFSTILALVVSPVLLLISAAVLLLADASYGRLPGARRRTGDKRTNNILSLYSLTGLAIILLLSLTLTPRIWLPPEVIFTTNSRPLVGYVVGETDTDVTVLTSNTDLIVHISPTKVISRTVCNLSRTASFSEWAFENLPTLIGAQGQSNYPVCSDIARQKGE